MFEPVRIHSLLERIEDAITLIDENASYIKSADDFLKSSDGMFTLSGVCMQLVFIGESVKVIFNPLLLFLNSKDTSLVNSI